MMYNSKLVVAVKANGRILREHQDAVYVPFGAEYTLMFKNLNTVRALVNLEIDGERMTGWGLVLEPGETIDLERSIKEGSLSVGNKFKFIERTAQIEAGPRGVKAEDGLIRVLFEFERPVQPWQPPVNIFSQVHDSWLIGSGASTASTTRGMGIPQNASSGHDGVTCSTDYSSSASIQDCYINSVSKQAEVGITVPGSISDQAFVYAKPVSSDGVKHVLVLRLLGEVAGVTVAKPVTVKYKPKCVTCGTQGKAGGKFCSACGTSLIIA